MSIFDSKIPNVQPTFKEMAEQMRINADFLMKEITEHANKEIERIKEEKNVKSFNY